VSLRVRILRGLSFFALLLAVVWFLIDPDFEPIITAILGLAGVLSAGLADPDRSKRGLEGGGSKRTQVMTEAPTPAPSSVAVLPLKNLSSDPESEFFSDGMTEDVISQLSKIGALKVISRTSCMLYKNREMGLRDIAADLGVENVVEGSVRRDGDRLRVVAQLIDASTDQHLWGETFDRQLTDVFLIQSEIAKSIADALEARLSPGERKRIDAVPTEDLEAYNLCLLGRHFWSRWTEEDLLRSTELFTQAVERDPGYARAHYELGVAWATLALGYWSYRPLDVFPKAALSIKRALELDSGLADAHAWDGLIKQWFELDWTNAETCFTRAITLDPSSAHAHDSYGWWLTSVARHEEAEVESARATELDPLSLFVRCNAALGAYRARDYGRSVQLFEHAISLDPNLPMGHGLSSLAHVKNGSPQLALEEAALGDRLSRGETPYLAMHAYALAACGPADDARSILEELEKRRRTENVWLVGLAMAYANLGEHDLAFERLEEAIRERVGWITWLGVEPSLDCIRDDPRFEGLLEKVGLRPELRPGRDLRQRSAPEAKP
jgi:TolB-like protein/Tfp pilus assembly protein PilF